MGKNNAKQQKAAPTEKQLAKREAAKQNAKKSKQKKLVTVVSLCAAGAVVLGGTVFAAVKLIEKDGYQLRNSIALESEHFYVTNAMLGYYFDNAYVNFLKANEGAENANLPDTSRSLKEQQFTEDETWYEYFMQASLYGLENTLKACENAYAAGYELSDEIKEECKQEAAAYQSDTLLKGVQAEDIASTLELQKLSSAYYNYAVDNISISEDELQEYCESHINNYRRCKTLCYSIAWTDETDVAEEGDTAVRLNYEQAKGVAENLAKTENSADFLDFVYDFLVEVKNKDEETAQNITDACLISSTMDGYSDEMIHWMTKAKTKVNDTYIVENKELSTFTVYMMIELPTLDESDTVDLRVICLAASKYDTEEDAMASAQELLDKWQSEGGGEELFAQYAKEYSGDLMTYSFGGLASGYSFNTKTYGEDLHKWAFDKARKAGDTGVFMTTNASVAAYFVGDNERNAFEAAAYSSLYQNKVDAISEAREQYSVVQYDATYNKLKY